MKIQTAFRLEEELLKDILINFNNEENYPDIFCGYNSSSFDIPYLINRCYKILGKED